MGDKFRLSLFSFAADDLGNRLSDLFFLQIVDEPFEAFSICVIDGFT